MFLPRVTLQPSRLRGAVTADFGRRAATRRRMRTRAVVVIFESIQLPLQINGIPEYGVGKILTPNGPDKPFDEGMR
jgi:hypothetical protein